jgi:hypothetical protein
VTTSRPATAAPPLFEDWDLVRDTRANLLLQGPPDATQQVLMALRPLLPGPVETVHVRDPLGLPAIGAVRSLIVCGIETLSPDDQQRLLDWMNAAPDPVQVITTTPASMMPMLESGGFLESLYYRLNIIYLALDAATP